MTKTYIWRRAQRWLGHSILSLRIASWGVAAGGMGLIVSLVFFFSEFAMLGIAVSEALLFFSLTAAVLILFIRRAARMMVDDGQSGGALAALRWGFRNGDLAIQIAYVALAVCVLALGATILGRPEPPRPIAYWLLCLTAFFGLRFGHMGRARGLPSRATVGSSRSIRAVGTAGLVVFACALVVHSFAATPLEAFNSFLSLGIVLAVFVFSLLAMLVTGRWQRNHWIRLQARQGKLGWVRPRRMVAPPKGRPRRLLHRYLRHAQPGFRLLLHFALLSWAMAAGLVLVGAVSSSYRLMVTGLWTFVIGLIALFLIAWLHHLNRARRMMAAAGEGRSVVTAGWWALQNGDLAIRYGYAMALMGLILTGMCFMAFSPRTALWISLPYLAMSMGVGGYLVTLGHLGPARHLASRAAGFEGQRMTWVFLLLALLGSITLQLAVLVMHGETGISSVRAMLGAVFLCGLMLPIMAPAIIGMWRWNLRLRMMAKTGQLGWLNVRKEAQASSA
jgi:hypothetical protein